MGSKFNVVCTGQLQEGVTEDEFVTKFCAKFALVKTKPER